MFKSRCERTVEMISIEPRVFQDVGLFYDCSSVHFGEETGGSGDCKCDSPTRRGERQPYLKYSGLILQVAHVDISAGGTKLK